MSSAPFYVVWNPNGQMPRYQHTSYESACTEAGRLARLSPGMDFHVLACVATARKNDLVFQEYEHDSDPIPF